MVWFFWWGRRLFNEDGIAVVRLNGKWNLIDVNGNFLSKQWFDYISYFENGLAKVKLNHKWNFIDVNGNFLSEQWFDSSFDTFCFMKKFLKWNTPT